MIPGFHRTRCDYEQDKVRILDLVRAYRLVTGVDYYVTTWRVRLLLSSRVWDTRDAVLWQASDGQLAALAFLWRHLITSPYLVLERFIYPELASLELGEEMLAWACQQVQVVAQAQENQLTLYAQEFPTALRLGEAFDVQGFTPVEPDPDEYGVYYSRSLDGALPEPILLETTESESAPRIGYNLYPAGSLGEVNTLHEASTFTAMSLAHQQECFESDEYSHMVIFSPNGEVAAYCECSIDRLEWQAGQEKLGWIDYLETLEAYQGKGLGQAALWAGLHRLQDWGAERVMLATISNNTSAVRLYEKSGFERVTREKPLSYQSFSKVFQP